MSPTLLSKEQAFFEYYPPCSSVDDTQPNARALDRLPHSSHQSAPFVQRDSCSVPWYVLTVHVLSSPASIAALALAILHSYLTPSESSSDCRHPHQAIRQSVWEGEAFANQDGIHRHHVPNPKLRHCIYQKPSHHPHQDQSLYPNHLPSQSGSSQPAS